jgi:cytochrome c peroxidase
MTSEINGSTTRHAMRLINSRFARENKFFWDERANTLELQTTQPIQNHIEMGLVRRC